MAKHRVNIDLRLIHDRQRWVAHNERIAVSGRTLAELGESVKKAVAVTGNRPPGTKVTVRRRFNYETVPHAACTGSLCPPILTTWCCSKSTRKIAGQPGKGCSAHG